MSEKIETKKQRSTSKKNELLHPPKDAFYIVYLLFFSFGILHYLPVMFFTNAHAYWMYKFRNTTDSVYNPKDLTPLEENFAIVQMIAHNFPSLFATIFSLYFGHKLSHRFKLLYTLTCLLLLFIALAVFTQISTDSWQTSFFVLVMIISAGISFVNYLFGMHNYSILAQFPKKLLGPFVNGQPGALLFCSTLQILSLAANVSTTTTGLIYFAIGSIFVAALIIATLYLQKNNAYYTYHMAGFANVKTTPYTLQNGWQTSKKIRPAILTVLAYFLALHPIHPACTSLIISSEQGNGNAWNDVYFIPVIAFFVPAAGALIGQILALKFTNLLGDTAIVIFAFARIIVFIPLVILCNIPEKKHVATIFGDSEYILIMVAFGVTNGYTLGMASFIIPRLVKPDEIENAFHIYVLAIELIVCVTSLSGFISVNLI